MTNLLDMSLKELECECENIGEKKFRAKQIYSWLTSYTPFESMSNIGSALRKKLRENYSEGYLKTLKKLESKDGTRKYLFGLSDGNAIESVLMKYEHGNTVCLSTQAGCRMNCAFCASCEGGLKRNLTAGEILSQVLAINSDLGKGRNITNIVLMGTGEPLDNFENVLKFLEIIHAEESLGISYRNISLSTCGLVDKLYEFIELDIGITLCISLHAAIDEKRRQLIPMANKYTVKQVADAAHAYFKKTGRRVIFEYILIKDFNDTADDIAALKGLLNGITSHINIIPYNEVKGKPFEAPSKGKAYEFAAMLEKNGMSATVRRALGADIAGACGQLRAGYIKNGG